MTSDESNTIPDSARHTFLEFINGRNILIVDRSAAARNAIVNCLTSLGVNNNRLTQASNYQLAEDEISRSKPSILICDYDLGQKTGLDLLQKQRLYSLDINSTLSVLVTSNTSQSAVAKAAEEDIDSYIVKPFSPSAFKSAILKAARLKLKPPPYLIKIEQGKVELADGNYDKACDIFAEAKTLDMAPALACYYLGQTRMIQEQIDGAIENYNQGLNYNKIHYKCLVGLYEVLMVRNQHKDAYDVLRKLSRYFPSNPQRLTAILRLAIITKCYDDVEAYYRLFTNIEERNDVIVKYICAALAVCGKYYLKEGHAARALELFEKAAEAGNGRTHILREITSALVDAKMYGPAEDFFKKFPEDTHDSVDYCTMELLIADRTKRRSTIIELGKSILAKGIHDPLIYQLLIERYLETGHTELADELTKTASAKWPDQRDSFEAIKFKNIRTE